MKSSCLLASLLLLTISACASPIPIPTAPPANSGDIIYGRDFEDNTLAARISNINGIMDYDQGSYRILIQQPSFNL
jgi:hypothetical protein